MGGQFLILTLLLIANVSFASQPRCEDLVEDVKAMQAAQKQLLQSLSNKNEMMATVLDQNASKLERNLSQRKAIKKTDLNALHVSARAFRGHEKRESALVARFEKASGDLLDQVQVCLSTATSLEKLGQR